MMISVKCQRCGKEFKTRHDRIQKYCNRECYYKNRIDKKISKLCNYCNISFFINKKNQKYCSQECAIKQRASKKCIEVTCKYCGIKIKKYLCIIKNSKTNNFYCSKECTDNDRRSINTPIYKNYLRIPRHTIFVGYRKWIIDIYERDNYTCQICGEKDNRIVAHHLIPLSIDYSLATNKENGLTLCHACHQYLHHGLNTLISDVNILMKMKDEFIKIKMLRTSKHINRKQLLSSWKEVECDYCHEKFYKTKQRIKITQHNFCNRQGSGRYKYSKHKVHCRKCDKEMFVSPSKFKIRISFKCKGDCIA